MRLRLLIAAAAILAIVLVDGQSKPRESAAAGRGEIDGSVLSSGPASGRSALAGWRVLLGTNECKLVATATTDAKGRYHFSNLDAGPYIVEIANDQPYGQGWELLQPSARTGVCYGWGASVIELEAGGKVTAEDIIVQLFDDPRGYYGSVFGDSNGNGQCDADEGPFVTTMRQYESDTSLEFATDLEGDYRMIESETPIPGNPVKPPLSLQTCPAHPVEGDNANGYRITAPVPDSCGEYGCVAQVSQQVFRCEDSGLYLVDPNPSYFIGEVWKNAAPVKAGTPVTAWIGDTDCGEGYVYSIGSTSRYEVIVRSASTRAGCGTEGAEVRFTLGGESTPTVGYWHVRTMQNIQQVVDIVIGPPFAVYDVQLPPEPGNKTLQAYIGDTLCGEATASGGGMVPNLQGRLVVPPESLRAGCGRDGATVRFVVDGVMYSPTQPWTPGTHRVQLTAAPTVSLPSTGSGGLLPQ